MPARYTGTPSCSIAAAIGAGSFTPTMVWLPTTSTGRSAARTALAAAAMLSCAERRVGNRSSGIATSGKVGALNCRYRCALTYHSSALAVNPLALPTPTSFSYQLRTTDSGYKRSTGTSTNTGPGTPPVAIATARSIVGPSAGTVLTSVAHLVAGFISAS